MFYKKDTLRQLVSVRRKYLLFMKQYDNTVKAHTQHISIVSYNRIKLTECRFSNGLTFFYWQFQLKLLLKRLKPEVCKPTSKRIILIKIKKLHFILDVVKQLFVIILTAMRFCCLGIHLSLRNANISCITAHLACWNVRNSCFSCWWL